MELVDNFVQFSVTLLGFCLSGKMCIRDRGSLARKSSDKNGAFQNDEGAAIFILHRKI